MAATKLIAMHQNKGRSVMRCLKDRTDYAMNGEKTDEGKYISSYQCNPELVDLEFAQAKKEYLHKTWRQPKGDVIAYQIRQSFKPGEITPEEANEVGYETGMRFTKGKHAFIVATHVDRAHIHNHIIFNSTNLECDRKFRDFWFSGIALQRLSDIICLEHGLSVIPKVKPSERQRRTKYPERVSIRDVIREDILKCLDQKPADFEELLKLLQAEGYEIKRGKHTAVCGKEQKRFILQTELPYQIKWFAQQYEAANGNADIQLYETMQFMGRYSVWEKLFPNIFNGKLRKHIFGSNPWMIDMYEFLIKHQDIESANKNYDQMFGIIKENFGGF